MLYNTNTIKQTNHGYEQAVTNSMNQEQSKGDCKSVQVEQKVSYQNRDIKVVLEFPTESNPQAEQKFEDFLKELYLKKIKSESMQKETQELESSPIGNMKDTKEDKNHE